MTSKVSTAISPDYFKSDEFKRDFTTTAEEMTREAIAAGPPGQRGPTEKHDTVGMMFEAVWQRILSDATDSALMRGMAEGRIEIVGTDDNGEPLYRKTGGAA